MGFTEAAEEALKWAGVVVPCATVCGIAYVLYRNDLRALRTKKTGPKPFSTIQERLDAPTGPK
jgi:hypothetical protein